MDASLAGDSRPIARPVLRILVALVITIVLGSCAASARRHTTASVRPRTGAVSTPPAPRRPEVSVHLGAEVDGLAADGGYLWAFARDSGVLVRVDQRTGQVRRFTLPAWRGLPVMAAATAAGVWLPNPASTRPALIRFSPQTGRIVARTRLPADGSITAAYGRLWLLVADRAFPPGWRVVRVNPATNRVDGISADTPGTQLTGHTAALSASAGKLWITGSMNVIVSLDPRTLAMHTAATQYLSEGWVFGDGHAWELDSGRPVLAEIDPRTGRVVRTLTAPPPDATGNDYVAAGHNRLWVFRGSQLTELNLITGRATISARVDPIAPSFPYYSPAVIVSSGLWYLAQTSNGIALDHLISAK